MPTPTHPANHSNELKLTQLLTQKTVNTGVSVSNWEEAADAVGALLVDAGQVDPEYIPAMKRVLKEMGPYAVIAPGIVLLHSRPEDGVREPCLGLITLSTPVEFGHSQNDPVDLVFALGATDKKGHINALQQLARLLGDSEALAQLRSAQDRETLLKVITTWVENQPAQ